MTFDALQVGQILLHYVKDNRELTALGVSIPYPIACWKDKEHSYLRDTREDYIRLLHSPRLVKIYCSTHMF